jgi:hypothetical protein
MKRSVQEIIELAVFGFVALLIGTGFLWLAGWVLGGVGWLLQLISGLLWALLRFIVPVAVIAGLVYLLVRWLQGQGRRKPPVTVAAEVEPAEPLPVAGAATRAPEAAADAVSYDPNDSWHPPVTAEGAVIEEATADEAVAESVPADEAAEGITPGTVDVFTAGIETAGDGNASAAEGPGADVEAGLPPDHREDT